MNKKHIHMYMKYLNDFWRFIGKVSKAIVSGIPSQKVYLEPTRQSNVSVGDEEIKPNFEKHYHRPLSRPAVEQQTLRKESKKAGGIHK
jgi:hypothetical protein